MIVLRYLAVFMLLAAHVGCVNALADEKLAGKVLILAAASTIDAVDELAAAFERDHPQVVVRTSFAASSTLARQIEAGAGADLFLSASRQWADELGRKGLVARQTDLLTNELVVVVPRDSKLEISKLDDLLAPAVRHVAVADPTSVPAGIYAKQALEKLELWKPLAGKATGAADVRQALQQVESGAAEAGIVYASDAATSRNVRIAARIDRKLTGEISYPLVLLKQGAPSKAAVAFYDFLLSQQAQKTFARHGFLTISKAAERSGQ